MTSVIAPRRPFFSTEPPPQIIEEDPAYRDRVKQARKKRLMLDPDTRMPSWSQVTCIYGWSDRFQSWWLIGFYRTRGKWTIGRIAKFRRRKGIPEHICLRFTDLYMAQAFGPGDPPPAIREWRATSCD